MAFPGFFRACAAATALLSAAFATAGAETVSVVFDAALTNGTGWTYNDKVKSGSKGYYFGAQGAAARSPRFDFAITSATATVSLTASCTRNLVVSPLSADGDAVAALSRSFNPPCNQVSQVVATWDADARVRSLAFETTSGGQNIYLLSAEIAGVPLVGPPTDLRVDRVSSSGVVLCWTNPDGAVSNRIDVGTVVAGREPPEPVEYDFGEFSNPAGHAVDATDGFVGALPAFAGSSVVYLPANSHGVVQISRDNAKGHLVHAGFADASNRSIVVSLKIPTASQGATFGIGYETASGATNQFATVAMTTCFTTNAVPMAGVPANAPIVFNTEGSGSKRVVHLEYLAFVAAPESAQAASNVVASAFAESSPGSVGGLSGRTEYFACVTAFDAEGNASPPSAPIAFTTTRPVLPFAIRIR